MSATNDLTRALLEALRGVDGLRAATPSTRAEASWVPWDLDAMAVDVDDDVVQLRLVALALPLPPVLRRAEAALRSVLDDSVWKNARLRLVITDIDASALNLRSVVAQGDGGHTIGS
ncbi:hypothetical protein ACSHWB_35165 [Lentzea sp. HUAS TT2]|uniref:hypothetical protein n=1 Tax=Lentzea sp. HUAS TT2 TaxID=3447454 RepID=UPI003F70FD1A